MNDRGKLLVSTILSTNCLLVCEIFNRGKLVQSSRKTIISKRQNYGGKQISGLQKSDVYCT